MLLEEAKKPARLRAASCRHCGAPIADPRTAESGFCCSGCAYVFRLVHEHGLGAYYRIKDPVTVPADAGVFQPRDYSWLRAAQKDAENACGDRPPELMLDIQGVSCAGCVWLIERLFKQETGARDIVVNAQLGSVHVRWFRGAFDAGAWASRLQTFGYLLGPTGEKPDELESTDMVRRIGLCTAFALNVMLFALPAYFGMRPDFEYAGLFRLLSLVFATLSVLVGGTYFIARAARALRTGVMHIDLPIAMGIVGAYAASLCGWLFGMSRLFYPDFVATFIVLMLVGRWAQVSAVERNRQRLLKQQPVPSRIRLASGGAVPRERLENGQVILIASGETVPVEARLEDSAAAFSLASINGEADSRMFGAGQHVPAGAVNLDLADARLRVLQPWSRSLLAQLLAPSKRAGFRHLFLERVIRGYVVGIIVTAALAGFGWWLRTHDPERAGAAAIAVLVVACPCAIGLALPLADEIATGLMRRRGVFVRENDLWSKLGRVRMIIFDKTGTLTLENPVLVKPQSVRALGPNERRALFTLVQGNPHPIGRCLHECLLAEGPQESLDGALEEEVGSGVWLGSWSLGRAGWRDDGPEGQETVLANAGNVVARFAFADSARPGVPEELGELARQGYGVYILSGDRREKVEALALELGLPPSQAVGELSPEQKAMWIEHHAPHSALMLGDGANDSLAFDRALCRGTPVIHRGILEGKADFYYLRRGIGGIRDLLAVDRTHRRVQGAIIAFSVAYNVAAAGFAVAGLVNPLVAAVVMPASSLASLAIVTVGMGSAKAVRSPVAIPLAEPAQEP
jgi:Cu2+-exporting ATPase